MGNLLIQSYIVCTSIHFRISILLVSMLTLICKLSELDPNLRPWLSWQPWCRFVCKSSSFVSVNVVSSHDLSHDSSMF